MDASWMSAPCLAIKVWREAVDAGDAGDVRWRINPALRTWSLPRGLAPAHWRSFATSLLEQGVSQGSAADHRVTLLGHALRAVFHPLEGAWLVWLSPAAVEGQAENESAKKSPASQLPDPNAAASLELFDAREMLSGKLAQAVSLASVSVWRIDLATQTVEFNDYGYRLNRLTPRPGGLPLDLVRKAVHPDDLKLLVAAAAAAVESDSVIDVEVRYRNDAGSYNTVLTRRVAERDAQGRAVALAGISIDQTPRIKARDQTSKLTRNIELVSTAAGVGVWSVDIATGQVEWNRQMYVIYGLPQDEPAPSISQWLHTSLHASDQARVATERRAALEAGVDLETEFRVLRPDGTVRSVVCRSHREVRGGREVAHGIHVDVTQRRATEGRLHLLEQRAMLANQAVGLGTWERDLVTNESQWDAQMYALRGLQPQDARSPNELRSSCLHPDDAALVTQRAAGGFAQAVAPDFDFEFRVVWPDGSVHWLNTRGLVTHNEAGQPVRALGVNWDVTQRKLAEQAMRDKLAAEQASRTKTEFLSSMSHELRTPLNGVLGFSQLLLLDAEETLTPEQARRVGYIQTAGQHLLALIEDVLDLAAVEAGASPLRIEPVAMHTVLGDVMRWIAPQAAAQRITLHTDVSPAWVNGDARRVRQVVVNLLSNAVKYNRADGDVWLSMRRIPAPHLQPGDAARTGWELSVRDTGRGFSATQVALVFEPFNRLGMEHEGIEGTGIGLTIVRDLVQRMGGHISVQSEPGQGSEFRVWWPAAEDIALPAPPSMQSSLAALANPLRGASTNATASTQALTLLYIEDNPVNLLLIQELLAQRPHIRLLCAADGTTGVAMALSHVPDVILIDMQLPDFDGLEVLKRLKGVAITAQSRMIALSANAMPDDVNAALAAGFNDYWTKPIDMKRVLEKLDALSWH